MNALWPIILAAEPANVGSGQLQGGWEYIWAAWILSWAGLVGYGLSLWVRRPKGS